MTDKENRVKQCELQVRTAKTRVAEARSALEHGYVRAKADFEREYSRLKCELERATIDVEREEGFLAAAKAELARGFEA